MRYKQLFMLVLFIFFLSLSTFSFESNDYNGFDNNMKYFSFDFEDSHGLFNLNFEDVSGYNSNYVFLVNNKTNNLIEFDRLRITDIRNRVYLYNLPSKENYEVFLFDNDLISDNIFFNSTNSNLNVNFLVANPFELNKNVELSFQCEGLSERAGDFIEFSLKDYEIPPKNIKIINEIVEIDYPNQYDCSFDLNYRDRNYNFDYDFLKLEQRAENIDISINPKDYGFEMNFINHNNVSTVVDLFFDLDDDVDLFPNKKQVALSSESEKNVNFFVFPRDDNLNSSEVNILAENLGYPIFEESVTIEFSKVFKENSLITFIVLSFFAIVLFFISLLINFPTKNGENNEN